MTDTGLDPEWSWGSLDHPHNLSLREGAWGQSLDTLSWPPLCHGQVPGGRGGQALNPWSLQCWQALLNQLLHFLLAQVLHYIAPQLLWEPQVAKVCLSLAP